MKKASSTSPSKLDAIRHNAVMVSLLRWKGDATLIDATATGEDVD